MSLLTRCPACTTLYRVVPDQLRISEGWVKCGQCSEIFDASQHLIEATIDTEPLRGKVIESSPTEDPPSSQDLTEDFLTPASADVDASDLEMPGTPDPGLDSDGHVASTTGSDEDTEFDWSSGLGYGIHPDDVPDVVTPTAEPGRPADVDAVSDPHQVRWDDSSHDDVPVTFLRGDKRTAFWCQPLVRGTLALACLGLGLTLAGQWVYLERDRLAAQQPELKPVLQAFCGFANCEVQPLKRIEALSVDSVGFHQLGKETYRLTFVVKNSSTLPLAIPSVELALTDAQDRPVFRRVFSSKDFGVAGAEIAAGADWPVVVALRVNSDTLAKRVFGYRLLVFYL